MTYPEKVDVFTEKLNKKQDGSVYVIEEEIKIAEGKFEGLLAHDNITTETIRVYSGPKLTGEEITDFTISVPKDASWAKHIRIFAEKTPVYVSYETIGDTVEADDINLLQEVLTATQTEAKRYQSENDAFVRGVNTRLATAEQAKAEKTYVDTQLLFKAEKADTYTKSETDARIQLVIDAAPEALNTLKEIADALNNDPDFAGTMTAQLAGKVDKVNGKGLSAEDYTAAEKNKLAGVAAGAQVNVIEKIKKNGTVLSIAGKTVDIDVPTKTSSLENDSYYPSDANYVHTDNNFTSAEKLKLAGVEENANYYVHPATHSPGIITQDSSNRFVTDAQKAAWNSKSELALGETETTAYRGDRGKLAYNHSQASHAPVNAQKNAEITKAEIEAKLTGSITSHSHSQYVTQDDLSGAKYGDMLKSVYDADGDGVVDLAESVPWSGVSGKPSTVSQAEAEAGSATTQRLWTAQRVAQAALAQAMPKGPLTWNHLMGV